MSGGGRSGKRAGLWRWPLLALLALALALQVQRADRRIEVSKVIQAAEQTTLLAVRMGRGAGPEGSQADRAADARTAQVLRANLRILKEAEEKDPSQVSVLTALGAQYRLLGRPDQAVEVYRRALALAPRPEVYLNLAPELDKLGLTAEAAEARRSAELLAEGGGGAE